MRCEDPHGGTVIIEFRTARREWRVDVTGRVGETEDRIVTAMVN